MDLVATLITAPLRKDLAERDVIGAKEAFEAEGWQVREPAWLDQNIACDLFFAAPSQEDARALAKRHFANANFDIIVQPRENRRKKLLLADMDSTIVIGETLDELADKAGIKDRVATITERAMRGELDFKAALFERVAMLKDLPATCLDETLACVELTPGARTLVQTMRAHDAYTVLVSGGFGFFTRHVAAASGFHRDHANELIVEGDRLTGRVGEPILDKESKLALLNRYVAELNVPVSQAMTTGDGANDLPMLLAAGLGVAYRAKPIVEQKAPASVRHGDLTALLYLQGYKSSEFID